VRARAEQCGAAAGVGDLDPHSLVDKEVGAFLGANLTRCRACLAQRHCCAAAPQCALQVIVSAIKGRKLGAADKVLDFALGKGNAGCQGGECRRG
jgi:hypothetical protein